MFRSFTWLAYLVFVTAPAYADSDRVRVVPTPDNAAHYALIEVENRFGLYNVTRDYQTEHGPVSLSYTTTTAHKVGDPASADTACIVALPDGVVAVPTCVDILERETGTIALVLFIGG